MSILEAITLGIIQGITEWLPISSEGIVSLVEMHVFQKDIGEAVSRAIWLHLGTWFAVVFYLRKDLLDLIKKAPCYFNTGFRIFRDREKSGIFWGQSSKEYKIISFLIISTIFTAIVGVPLFKLALETQLPAVIVTALIGVFLIITGLIQKYAPKSSLKSIENLNILDGVLLGVVQGFAILPGLSRSGLTISALLFRKYNDEDALKLSFLMSIPAIFGAQIILILKQGIGFIDWASIVGLVLSFVFGLITINLLMTLARSLPFWKFTIFLGVFMILAVWILL